MFGKKCCNVDISKVKEQRTVDFYLGLYKLLILIWNYKQHQDSLTRISGGGGSDCAFPLCTRFVLEQIRTCSAIFTANWSYLNVTFVVFWSQNSNHSITKLESLEFSTFVERVKSFSESWSDRQILFERYIVLWMSTGRSQRLF